MIVVSVSNTVIYYILGIDHTNIMNYSPQLHPANCIPNMVGHIKTEDDIMRLILIIFPTCKKMIIS